MAMLAPPAIRRREEPEWTVLLTVAVALLIGYFVMTMVQGQTQAGTAGPQSVAYPAAWVQTSEPGATFAAADLNRSGPFGPRVSLRQIAQKDLIPHWIGGGTPSLLDAAQAWSTQRGTDLVGYRVLKISPNDTQKPTSVDIESGYLMEASAGSGAMPGLMHAIDTLKASGDSYYILTFAADANQFAHYSSVRDALLASWHTP